MARGKGFTQTEARRRAKELDGVAISARPNSRNDRWILGGWPSEDEVWIVISLDHKKILDDNPETGEEHG